MRLVLMRQEFLLALYAFVGDYHHDVVRRRPLFSDAVVRLLQSAPAGGYLILDASDVAAIKNELLDTNPVEHAIDRDGLLRALDG
jgi:hypothetical protein